MTLATLEKALTHRIPVYHNWDFIGYLRLTSTEKGQLTRGNNLIHHIGEEKPLQGSRINPETSEALYCCLRQQSKSIAIYSLLPLETSKGLYRVRLWTNKPLAALPSSRRLLLTNEIQEKSWK